MAFGNTLLHILNITAERMEFGLPSFYAAVFSELSAAGLSAGSFPGAAQETIERQRIPVNIKLTAFFIMFIISFVLLSA